VGAFLSSATIARLCCEALNEASRLLLLPRMRFDEDHESPDIIDRRGERSSGIGGGGLLALAPLFFRGPVGIALGLVLVGVMILGGYFGVAHDEDEQVGITQTTAGDVKESPTEAKDRHLAAFVLDDAQQTWRGIFARAGRHYESAQLVLYRDETKTACGFGEAATGPFYCPSDDHVYIDLSFDDELATRFGAKGDFAQAYVLAHEIGHHVQKLLGATAMIKNRGAGLSKSEASVRLELQADCYAGVWAHSTDKRGLLEPGDIESAMNAAAAVGDDRLQRMASGHVSPETFTHGTSEQRERWFKAGYEHGDVESCDTFSASGL
jgi:predicted metalloprotease